MEPRPESNRDRFQDSSSALFQRATALIVFPRRWLRNGLAATTIGLAGLGGGWFYLNRQATNPNTTTSNVPPLSVSTIVVPPQAIVRTQVITGTVEPIDAVTTISRYAGQVISLPVKIGDRVKAGQVLAKIAVRKPSEQSQQPSESISQAVSSVNVAQSALDRAVASENQISTQLDRVQFQQQQAQAQYRDAVAQKQSVQSELNNARSTQQRRVTLQRAGAIGQSSLYEINTQVTTLKSRLQKSAEEIVQAQADIAQSNDRVKYLQAAQTQARTLITKFTKIVSQAQAKPTTAAKPTEIATSQEGIVSAPFNGVVTQTFTQVGAIASTGQSIVTVENTSRQHFSVDLPTSAQSQITPGSLVKISFEGIPAAIQGKVERVMPTANPNSRSFNAKIALSPTTSLRSGMFGKLTIETAVLQKTNIPTTALISRDRTPGVYVVGGDRHALFRQVNTGTTQNGRVEIVSGLSAGDRVVTSNLDRLKEGQLVNLSN